jgi:hypothetical protein
VTPSDTCDTVFLAHFLKNAFYALSVEWEILTKFTEPNCSTETAVCGLVKTSSVSRDKLDEVGPVDNKPSPNKLQHFFNNKKM